MEKIKLIEAQENKGYTQLNMAENCVLTNLTIAVEKKD